VSSLPGILLFLSLLAANNSPPEQHPCKQDIPRVILYAEPADSPPQVCIGWKSALMLSFDSPIKEAYIVESTQAQVTFSGRLLTLITTRLVAPGTELHLKVMFKSNDAPVTATLLLVVHSSEMTRRVEVNRRHRTMDSYQEEVWELRLKNVQLQKELERLRSQGHRENPLMGPSPSDRATVDTEPRPEQVRLALREEPGGAQHHLAPLALH